MHTPLLYLLTAGLLLSCGNSSESNNATSAVADLPATADVETTSDKATCLTAHANKGTLDQLLPLETIKKHYNIPAQATKEYSYRPEAKKHDKDTYEYTWDSDRIRKMKMMGREMESPSPNRVGLRWVGSDLFMITGKATPLESFRAFYRNATAAEKEAAFKKAGDRMKEKGYDAKTVDAATGMGNDLASDEIIFRDVTGVGDAASWRIKDKELTVLIGKRTFQVMAEISANDDENIGLAKKLAAEVLAKCQ
jgi:hypothetical protein